MDGTDLGGLVDAAAVSLAQLGGHGGILRIDGGAQLLLKGLEFTQTHTVAEVGLFAGAQTLDCGFSVSHFLLSLNKLRTIKNFVKSLSIRVYENTTNSAFFKRNTAKCSVFSAKKAESANFPSRRPAGPQ